MRSKSDNIFLQRNHIVTIHLVLKCLFSEPLKPLLTEPLKQTKIVNHAVNDPITRVGMGMKSNL